MNLSSIIIKPVITEKTLNDTARNRYTFLVKPYASKGQIRQAVETSFNVSVVAVRTSKKKPVQTRTGRKRLPTKTSLEKKAIVELKPGDTIKHFELKD